MTRNKWLIGLQFFRSGRYFEAHEEWEDVWKAGPGEERDFYQGMVHLTVAMYQAGRGNARGARSQIKKARRRLAAYQPEHRGVPLEKLVPEVEGAVERVLAGEGIASFKFDI